MNTWINLTYFNDEDIDVDEEIRQFEEEWEEPDEEDTPEVEEEETPEVEEGSEPESEPEAGEEEEEPEGEETPAQFDTQKQNQAFRDMRQQLEQERKYADVVRRIAKQQGVSEDQIIQNFEQKQMEREAKEQNVPVEMLERVKRLEKDKEQLETQTFQKDFNNNVEKTKEEFGLGDEDIKKVFSAYKENGWNPKEVSFDQAYKLSNFDTILEKRVEAEKQKQLEAKRKRKNGATIPDGKGGSPKTNTGNLSDEEHDDILKEMGLEL